MSDDVYVVTLQLDSASFEWLQALRVEHFPKSRNWLPAHLTLFHTVSTDQAGRLKDCWRRFGEFLPLRVRFTGIRSLGGGTAFDVDSPGLTEFRRRMMEAMMGQFSRQDLQPFKAHVTIQNKVESSAARSLQERLSCGFAAREGIANGVMIWRYLGGPWSLDSILPFRHCWLIT
jgi:2'-5' RNA ligase superfamily